MDNKNKLLEKGIYKEIPFYIIQTYAGWPCCYIDVANVFGFKFDYDFYDDIDIDCHGGCTYVSDRLIVGGDVFKGKIVGWDYAHWGDWVPYFDDCSGHKWTLDELRAEVFEVIDDLKNRY